MTSGWLTPWTIPEDNRCQESVPSFVPTTNPYRVRRSVEIALESLAGRAFCGTLSLSIALRLTL